MIEKILVAYDGTREGRTGLFQFTETVALKAAEIHLLAVVAMPTGALLSDGFVPDAVMESEKQRSEEIVREGCSCSPSAGIAPRRTWPTATRHRRSCVWRPSCPRT